MRRALLLLVLPAALGCASSGGPVPASAPAPERHQDAASPADDRSRQVASLPAGDGTPASDVAPEPTAPKATGDDAETTAIPIAGSDHVRGRSKVLVHAPIAKVRESVLGFADYPAFMPHYKGCKVLGRTPTGARDVYMQIEVAHGAMTLWARVEISKPKPDGDGGEVIESKFVEGNVKDFQARWRLKAIDPTTTELELEAYMNPGMFLPTRLLNRENTEGAEKGVVAMRNRVEGK